MAEEHDADEMERDLKDIGERLRDMQSELRDREPVHPDPPGLTEGDPIRMNPLTDPEREP